MQIARENGAIAVGDAICSPRLNRITRDGRTVQVEPKVMQVLVCLAASPGVVVQRRTLLDTVWADTAVSEQVLSRAVSELRKIFGDDSRTPRVIETIAKSGYRLIAPVETVADPDLRGSDAARSGPENARAASRRSGLLSFGLFGLIGIMIGFLVGAAGVWLLGQSSGAGDGSDPVRRELSVVLPARTGPWIDFQRSFDLSRDGNLLAFTGNPDGQPRIYLRRLALDEIEEVPGTSGGYGPFFSPDGRQLGFYAEGRLRRAPLDGGETVTLFPDASDAMGASWSRDGTIVFTRRMLEGLWVKPPTDAARPLTTLDADRRERSHFWPHFLPDGRRLLFTVWHGGSINDCSIELFDLDSSERRVLIESGSDARFVRNRLVFARAATLLEVPFDVEQGRVTGPENQVLEGLWAHPISGAGHFATDRVGSLIFAPTEVIAASRRLVRRGGGDGDGARVDPLPVDPGPWAMPRISPDDSRFAVVRVEFPLQVWLGDLERGTLERLTDDGHNLWPLWRPTGQELVYSSERDGSFNLYLQAARGEAPAERLTESPNVQHPGSFHPDGNLLAYSEFHPDRRWDIWLLTLDGDRTPRPLLQTPFDELRPSFSPDGRLLAYVSNEAGRWDDSGRWEVYLRPLADPETRVQLSTEGGVDPVWSRDGHTVFFRQGQRLMAVDLSGGATPSVSDPRLVIEDLAIGEVGVGVPTYDVGDDGRFLSIRTESASLPTELRLILGAFPSGD